MGRYQAKLEQKRALQNKFAQSVLKGRYGFFEDDVVDPAGDGPMIPEHAASASVKLEAEPQAETAR